MKDAEQGEECRLGENGLFPVLGQEAPIGQVSLEGREAKKSLCDGIKITRVTSIPEAKTEG